MIRPAVGSPVEALERGDEWRTGVVVHQGRNTGGIYTLVRMDDTGEEIEWHPARIRRVEPHHYLPCRADDEVPASERCGECGQGRSHPVHGDTR